MILTKFTFIGLFWTLILLTPFIFFSSMVYSGSNFLNVFRQLSRLLVNILIWFVVTTFVMRIENWTGICSLNAYDDHFSCVRNGGSWFGFDISGHCFLLTYCSLTMIEELGVFRYWDLIPKALKRASLLNDSTQVDENEESEILAQYRSYSPTVQILFILSTLLMLLWDFMFLITSLYYHTWSQNITGFAIAAGSWYLTYRFWYRTPYSPGLPGESKLNQYIDSKWKALVVAD